jgi:hypothetical protein
VLTEDLTVFFPDFGTPATWYGVPWAMDPSGPTLDSSKGTPTPIVSKVLFDTPDQTVLGGRAQSRDFKMRFITSAFAGIKNKDAIVIAGTKYSVRTASTIDDGATSEATLEEVIYSPGGYS